MRITAAARALTLGGLLVSLAAGAVPALADAGPWANFHGDATHRGLAAYTGPRGVTLAWYGPAPDDFDGSAAIATDGTAYAASTDGTVQAFSPEGGLKWIQSLRSRVYASPVLDRDGRVLLGDSAGRFRAYNPGDGSIAFTLSGLGTVRGTAAVAPDGTIYFGTDRGELISLDPDFKERFRVQAPAGILAAPAIAANGDLFWAALDSQLRRSNRNGDAIWSVPVDGDVVSAPAIGPDGTVYVGAGGSLLAIDPSGGAVKWRGGLGGTVSATPAIGPDGSVYVGAENGVFAAFTSSGAPRWQYQTGGAIHSSAAVGADGTIYFGSGDGNLYVLDSSGQKVSNYHALDAVHGPAALAPNGLVYIGSRDNRLYAFKDSARRLTESPADRLGGDLARDASTGRVYVIVDGKRRYIPDPTTELILGLAGPLPITLSSSDLARYPEGPALPALAEGSLIQQANGPIYVIRSGRRAWIHNLDEFAAGGYAWESIIQVEDRVARSIPLTMEEGILLKGFSDRVYQVTSGQRHWVTTAAAFTSRGFNWSQVHFVTDATLNALPEGDPLA